MEDFKIIEDTCNQKCGPGVSVGGQCIIEIKGHFFLIVELESKSGCSEFDRILVMEISPSSFQFLCSQGVKPCKVFNRPPVFCDRGVILRCTFMVGNHAYNIFEDGGMRGCEKLVVVKTPICNICE